MLAAPRWEEVPAGLGVAAALLLAVGLAGWSQGIAFSLAVLGSEYTVMLLLADRDVNEWAPLIAAGLVIVAELAYWSLEARSPVPDAPGMVVRGAVTLTAEAIGAAALGVLVLGASTLPLGGGTLLLVLGVAGSAGILLLAARLAVPAGAVDSRRGRGSSG